MNRLYVNSINFTDYVQTDLSKWTLDISTNTDEFIEIGNSSEIIIDGEGYEYLYNEFIVKSCDSYNTKLKVIMYDKCCDREFKFYIDSKSLNFCFEDCKVKVNLKLEDDSDCLNKMQGIPFWSPSSGWQDDAVAKGSIYKMTFVKELDTISYVLMFMYFLIIAPIVEVIDNIIDAINSLGGNLSSIFTDRLQNDILGAGEYRTVPLIKQILEFWAKKCNLGFESSIFQNAPYDCLGLYMAQYNRGVHLDNCIDFDESNAANLNIIQLINMLKPVFNAGAVIKNGKLHFDTEEKLENLKVFFIDLANVELKECPDIYFNDDKLCAYFNGHYTQDSRDTQGNESSAEYNAIVEWNPTGSKNLKGECETTLQFSPVAFTHDKRKNDFTSWAWARASRYKVSTGTCEFTHSVRTSQNTGSELKLIVIDKNYSRKCGNCVFHYAIRRQVKPGISGTFRDDIGIWEYNFPMWFTEGLYKFHESKDPSKNKVKRISIDNVVYFPDDFCGAVEFLLKNKTCIYVNYGDLKKGSVENILIDFGKNCITLKKIAFKCQ